MQCFPRSWPRPPMSGEWEIGRGSSHRRFCLLLRPRKRQAHPTPQDPAPHLPFHQASHHRHSRPAHRRHRREVIEMLSLIETLTGFAAIMLMLSLLVKTVTSVIKNHWDYYSDNLKHEVQRLALETTGKTWDTLLKNPAAPDWA